MPNIAIIRYEYQEGFKRRKVVVVDFHIALLRVIGYCIRSMEFHDTEHVNGACVNLLRKSWFFPRVIPAPVFLAMYTPRHWVYVKVGFRNTRIRKSRAGG